MMVTSFRVMLDACSLVPHTLCDTLLTLAEHRLYVPQWSQDILDEFERNSVKRSVRSGHSSERAASIAKNIVTSMTAAFPDSLVEGYTDLVPAMTCHPKDRHVLAAAVRGSCELIVTSNGKDFPEMSLRPYGIRVQTPDAFLLDLLGFDERLVMHAIQQMAAAKTRPPMTNLEMLQRLAKTAKHFAAALLLLIESEEARCGSD
jgi:hypothetical protein